MGHQPFMWWRRRCRILASPTARRREGSGSANTPKFAPSSCSSLATRNTVCGPLQHLRDVAELGTVTQGGDIGFYITRALGLLYPSACRASHINYIHAGPPTWAKHPLLALQHATTPYSDREKKGLARRDWFMTEGSGYRMEHATKPQTLGYSLADSPVGLLAWIYEKMHDWTDDYPWTDDEVLTWVSVYWFSTAGPAASVRIYYENTHDPDRTMFDRVQDYIPDVPLGLASSPKDLLVVPKLWGRTLGPVIYENDYQRGGHFATSERPEAVVHDLQTMFGKDGGAYGVVEGRDGYGGSPTNVEL